MKAKKVIALMMTAALTTTSGGVTTLADQVDDTAVGIETVVEEAGEAEEEVKADAGAVEDTANAYIASVAATSNKQNCTVEDSVAIATTVTYAGGVDEKTDVASVKYQLLEGTNVVSETGDGEFAYTITKKGVSLTVRVYVTLANGKQVYADSTPIDLGTTTEKTITSSDVAVPTFADVVAKDAVVRAADVVLKDQLDAFNETVKYGKWAVDHTNDNATGTKTLKTGANTVTLTFTPTADSYKAASTITATVPVTVIQKAYKVEVKDNATVPATSGTLQIGTDGKGTKVVLTATLNEGSTTNFPTEAGVIWSTDSDKVRISSETKDRAVVTALKATDANETITITATSTDGEAVGTYKITAITEGVTTSTISMPTAEEMAKVTFNNKYTTTKEYFNDLLDAYNEKYAEYGTFTVASTNLESALSNYDSDKKTKVAGEYKDDIKVTFTLKAGLTAAGTGWSSGKIEKTYSTTVEKMKVDNDESFEKIIGTIKDEYDYGTTLDDIVDTTNPTLDDAGEFTISWLGMNNAEVDATKELPLGDFSYKIQYNLTDKAAANYELVNQDKTLYTVKSKIAVPEVEVTVAATPTGTAIGDKYNATKVALAATPNVTKSTVSNLYENPTYQWYKDGVALTADDNAGYNAASIDVLPADGGVYTCEVSYTLTNANDTVGSLKADKKYATIKGTSDPETVLFTKIDTATLAYKTAGNITYGEKKELTATIKGTDVSNYRVYYKALDKDGNAVGNETVLIDQSVDEDMAELFKATAGETINVKAENLPVGSYMFYLEVTAGEGAKADTVVTKTATALTVSQKIVNANELDESKLEASNLTYGQKLSEAVVKYADEEISTALEFAFVDDTVANAGAYVAQKVSAKVVNDNYKLVGTPDLTADVTVEKAALTVAAKDETITAGNAAKLEVVAEGLVNEDTLEDTGLTVEATVNGSKNTTALAAGSYAINVALTGEAANYDVTTKDGKLVVTAKAIEAAEVKVDQTSVTFDTIGATTKVTATVTPDNATDKAVTWTTSDAKVATVAADGTITAVGNGTATVTVATANGKTATVAVTVSQKAEKVSLTIGGQKASGTLAVKVKGKYQFKATVTPSTVDAKNAAVTWTSSNKKVATVDNNGKVTVKKTGTTTITAKTADGKTASVKLKAQKNTVKATKLKISGKATMKVKGTQTLKVTFAPATVDSKKVTWKSSNSKIATVNKNGKVTAKKKGTVTITATAKDGSGKKASIKIKVK